MVSTFVADLGDLDDLEDDEEVYSDEEEVGEHGQLPYMNQNYYVDTVYILSR